MSTLRVGTISNTGGTASTSADNVINGCAKAWVNFNGTGTVAIRQGYNVSSITDNGTGDYTVNFTTALADANYASVGGSYRDTNGASASFQFTGQVYTTSAVRVGTGGVDNLGVFVAVFR